LEHIKGNPFASAKRLKRKILGNFGIRISLGHIYWILGRGNLLLFIFLSELCVADHFYIVLINSLMMKVQILSNALIWNQFPRLDCDDQASYGDLMLMLVGTQYYSILQTFIWQFFDPVYGYR
jgi:hypothetical protein